MRSEAEKKEPRVPLTQRHLLRGRTVLVFGPIEARVTREVVTQILLLNHMSKTKPIRVCVNSPGGLADDGFAIYDVMRFVSAPVLSICTGLAASAATMVMVGAKKGSRFIFPHSRVMLHQPRQGAQGSASDIAITAREILRLREKANALFARETGHDLEKIQKDMHRDFWMSAEEAVEYGIVDRVIESERDLPS